MMKSLETAGGNLPMLRGPVKTAGLSVPRRPRHQPRQNLGNEQDSVVHISDGGDNQARASVAEVSAEKARETFLKETQREAPANVRAMLNRSHSTPSGSSVEDTSPHSAREERNLPGSSLSRSASLQGPASIENSEARRRKFFHEEKEEGQSGDASETERQLSKESVSSLSRPAGDASRSVPDRVENQEPAPSLPRPAESTATSALVKATTESQPMPPYQAKLSEEKQDVNLLRKSSCQNSVPGKPDDDRENVELLKKSSSGNFEPGSAIEAEASPRVPPLAGRKVSKDSVSDREEVYESCEDSPRILNIGDQGDNQGDVSVQQEPLDARRRSSEVFQFEVPSADRKLQFSILREAESKIVHTAKNLQPTAPLSYIKVKLASQQDIILMSSDMTGLTGIFSVLNKNDAVMVNTGSLLEDLLDEVGNQTGLSLNMHRLSALPPRGQYSAAELIYLSKSSLSHQLPRDWHSVVSKFDTSARNILFVQNACQFSPADRKLPNTWAFHRNTARDRPSRFSAADDNSDWRNHMIDRCDAENANF